MKITLRSLYKDLEKVTGNNLRRTSFGMSDDDSTLLATGGGILTTGLILTKIAHKKQKAQMEILHDKIDEIEKKFKDCNIPFEKVNRNYFVNKWLGQTAPLNTNIPERIDKLKEALINKKTKFGNNKINKIEDLVIENPNKSLIAASLVSAGVGGSINYYMYKKNIKNYKKQIENIKQELKSICKR